MTTPPPSAGSMPGPNIPPHADRNAAPQADSGVVALNRSPGFWTIMGYAVLLGVVLAFAALVFLWVVKRGTHLWFTLPKNPGWLDGNLWWVAVTGGAGVLVGVLRRVFRLPAKLAGTSANV